MSEDKTYKLELTEEQHAGLLICLGMAAASANGDMKLLRMVRMVVGCVAPGSYWALKEDNEPR